jgi:hypothetical protein
MKTWTQALRLALVAGLALTLLGGPATAVTKTPFTYTMSSVTNVSPGTV